MLLDENRDHILQVNERRIRHNIGGTDISVGIYDACGKWDLNSGHIDILKALLMKLLPAGSKTFMRELLKVRETNAGFQHVNQILALPSSKDLDLSQFIKEITIHCRRSQVDPSNSSDLMREVLGALPSFLSRPGPGNVFEIRATNNLGPGSRISVQTFLNITHDPLEPIKTLSWQSNY